MAAKIQHRYYQSPPSDTSSSQLHPTAILKIYSTNYLTI
jgi:hypothetical protein